MYEWVYITSMKPLETQLSNEERNSQKPTLLHRMLSWRIRLSTRNLIILCLLVGGGTGIYFRYENQSKREQLAKKRDRIFYEMHFGTFSMGSWREPGGTDRYPQHIQSMEYRLAINGYWYEDLEVTDDMRIDDLLDYAKHTWRLVQEEVTTEEQVDENLQRIDEALAMVSQIGPKRVYCRADIGITDTKIRAIKNRLSASPRKHR